MQLCMHAWSDIRVTAVLKYVLSQPTMFPLFLPCHQYKYNLPIQRVDIFVQVPGVLRVNES